MNNAGDLQSNLDELTGLFKELSDQRKKLVSTRTLIKEKALLYEKARLKKLKHFLKENNKGWCAICDNIFDIKNCKLSYVEYFPTDSERYSFGYDLSSSEIVNLCSGCFDSSCGCSVSAKYAFDEEKSYYYVEHRADGYFYQGSIWTAPEPRFIANSSGVWEKVYGPCDLIPVHNKTKIRFLPEKISKDVVRLAKLPPCIKIIFGAGLRKSDFDNNDQEDRIVIE